MSKFIDLEAAESGNNTEEGETIYMTSDSEPEPTSLKHEAFRVARKRLRRVKKQILAKKAKKVESIDLTVIISCL